VSIKKTTLPIALACLLILPAMTLANDAQKAFEQGKTLVSQGDFEGAMQAFSNAARADRSNMEYMQNFSLVRQVILIQNALVKEENDQRWEYYARALHTYYVSENLYDLALKLDTQIHERVNSAGSAALLAETQLAMDKNAEAVELLSKLPADKTNVVTESLEGIALARLGKKDDALKQASRRRRPGRSLLRCTLAGCHWQRHPSERSVDALLRADPPQPTGRFQSPCESDSRVCFADRDPRVPAGVENGIEGSGIELQRRQ
jgi:tetratricopeptide (TPR) repeat protein